MSPTLRTTSAALSVRPGSMTGAQTGDTGQPPHTLTVSATGTVTVIPDVARVYLGVTLTSPLSRRLERPRRAR